MRVKILQAKLFHRETLFRISKDQAPRPFPLRQKQEATSLGFWIDGRFGKCGVAINDDDDESYRCPEIAAFTQRHLYGIWLEEIGDLDSRAQGLGSTTAVDEAIISVEDAIDGLACHSSVESFCEWLHQKTIAWVSEWLASMVGTKWIPCWVHVEESSLGIVEIWRYGKRPLPANSNNPALAGTASELSVPESGLKVYRLATSRQYGYNWMEHKPGNPRFRGVSVIGNMQQPVPLKTHKKWLKIGSLAGSSSGTFALRDADPASVEIRAFLTPYVEFVPANDGDENWWLVNALEVADVLDNEASQFRKYGGQIDAIQFAEFDVEKLRHLRAPVFKIKESPLDGPYFLERAGEESFPQFCGRKELNGLDWELIWCEDTTAIEQALSHYVASVEARLMRIERDCAVKNSINFECLSGLQKMVWKISRFRDLVAEKGILEALDQVPGVGSLHIAAIRRKLGEAWQYENYPRQQGIESCLEKAFKRRDMLLDLRGFMCCCLPRVIKELRNMEKYGTGRRAAFGPAV